MTLMDTQTDLAVRDDPPAQPLAPREQAISLLPVPQMRAVLAEYGSRRDAFRRWLLGQLVEGVHFGVPPGCEPKPHETPDPRQWRQRPSLYKAGADFICDLLLLDPTFEPDPETWKMLGSKDGTVVIRCRLISRGDSPFFAGREKGDVIGEGRGSGTAGVKRRDANGAIKIAQKSSKVDAVINALGLSDLFTQDIEDTPPPSPRPDHNRAAPQVATRAERAAQAVTTAGTQIQAETLNELYQEWGAGDSSLTKARFVQWCKEVVDRAEIQAGDLSRPSSWTPSILAAVREAIQS